MKILAIDPANELTAYVIVDTDFKIYDKGKVPNSEMLEIIERNEYDIMAIEIIANFGLSGRHLFETSEMIGRCDYANTLNGKTTLRIKRNDVKKHFKVKRGSKQNPVPGADSQIRTSLINRFGEVGTKASPGYFYKFKEDIWQAMAVLVYTVDNKLWKEK